MSLLEVRGLTKYFGGVCAVDELDFHIDTGEIVGLIGPNGAGKTTLFNSICGVFPPTRGKVTFEGNDVTGLKPHTIARKGIIRTFQLVTLFEINTVLHNVILGFHKESRSGLWDAIFSIAATRRSEREIREKAEAITELVGLADVKDEVAKNLPGGRRKALSIAVALAASPKILFLDEPVSGMSASETDAIVGLIRRIRDTGMTILLIEHVMRVVMDICERIVVLNFGRKIAEGSPGEVGENPEVIKAYLGERRGTVKHQ